MKTKKGFKISPAHASQKRLFGETEIYLMGSVLNPFKSKCGISDRTGVRRGQVDNGVRGAVYVLFGREVMFGWACEQLVHFIYQLQNAPMRSGTGKREWFWNFNPIFGSVFLWLTISHGIRFEWYWYWLAFMLPFVWIDGLLWLVFFRFLGWAFCALMLFLIDKIGGFGIFEALTKFI